MKVISFVLALYVIQLAFFESLPIAKKFLRNFKLYANKYSVRVFTSDGIKQMNVHTLYAIKNSKITNKYNNILYLHK